MPESSTSDRRPLFASEYRCQAGLRWLVCYEKSADALARHKEGDTGLAEAGRVRIRKSRGRVGAQGRPKERFLCRSRLGGFEDAYTKARNV